MTLLEKALKKSSKRKLLEVIRAALDCSSHFYKPTIINNDDFFVIGERAIVICDQCVDRLREVLCIEKDDSIPTHFEMFGD